MEQRIKFYPLNDFATNYNLLKAESIIVNFDSEKKHTVNDILELHNIKKYFDVGARYHLWTNEQYMQYKKTVESFAAIIGKYLATLSNDNFIEKFNEIEEYSYREAFLDIIVQYKTYKKISEESIKAFLELKDFYIKDIVKFETLVNHFCNTIRVNLLSNKYGAELLLDKYAMGKSHINLPENLSMLDKQNIVIHYLDSNNPNINFVRLIENIRDSNDFVVPPKIRLKAKRLNQQMEKEFFKDTGGSVKYKISVGFSEMQNDTTVKNNGLNTEIIHSSKWLCENTDFSTLFNNFIYLFEFVDIPQMRFTGVSNPTEMGIFERFSHLPKEHYPISFEFNYKNRLALLQMHSYYKELNKLGIRLEDMCEWFFNVYLKEEFGIENYFMKMPTKLSSYREKCRDIAPEMEKILKQYMLWVEEGEIDGELLHFTYSYELSQIKSKLEKKYAYIKNGADISNILFCLFSDQSMLGYLGEDQSFATFYEAFNNRCININEYQDYQKFHIRSLIDHNILTVAENGNLQYVDKGIIAVLADLYHNQTVSYWHYPKFAREIIDIFFSNGYIEFENTLFSKQEREYLNYYLNKSEFVNGWDIRNSFLHGTEDNNHENSYMSLLMLFVLIIIKINDDLCLFDENKQAE